MANTTKSRRIALIPGDGIGVEVAASARAVLAALDARHDLGHQDRRVRLVLRALPRDGRPHASRRAGHAARVRRRPPRRRRVGGRARPRLPVGPADPDPPRVQPVREPASGPLVRRGHRVPSPTRENRPIDLVIVRENNEGEYSEIGGRFGRGGPEETAVQEAVFTRRGISRIADYALELAARRGRRVTSATKSNGLVHSMPFWDEVVRERAALHPEVELVEEHVDALAAKLVLRPESFDVIVASNLFGDILSDLAAAVTGSIGIAPSANLDPTGEQPVDVRAGPRIGARHRGQGPRQPGRHAVVGRAHARAPRRRRARRPTDGRHRGDPARSRDPHRRTWAAPPRPSRSPPPCWACSPRTDPTRFDDPQPAGRPVPCRRPGDRCRGGTTP